MHEWNLKLKKRMNTFFQALKAISKAAPCIEFIDRDESHESWVHVQTSSSGCWAYVGHAKGIRIMNLGPGREIR